MNNSNEIRDLDHDLMPNDSSPDDSMLVDVGRELERLRELKVQQNSLLTSNATLDTVQAEIDELRRLRNERKQLEVDSSPQREAKQRELDERAAQLEALREQRVQLEALLADIDDDGVEIDNEKSSKQCLIELQQRKDTQLQCESIAKLHGSFFKTLETRKQMFLRQHQSVLNDNAALEAAINSTPTFADTISQTAVEKKR